MVERSLVELVDSLTKILSTYLPLLNLRELKVRKMNYNVKIMMAEVIF